jgi:type VI secretion system secreted protein Hcp
MADPTPALKTRIDGFLKVPDIPGPSERDGHEEEIEVYGVSFTMTAPYDPNSLSRRGRVSLGMVIVTKHYDMSSPYLAQALYENKKLDEVVFTCRRTIEGETSDYLVVTLTDASVVTYDMHASAEEPDVIEDVVGFAYKTIKFVYDDDHEAEMNVATAA